MNQHQFELGEAEVVGLGERGYFVRDGFFGTDLARVVRGSVVGAAQHDVLRPAGISRGDQFRVEATIRGDRIGWVDADVDDTALVHAHARFDLLRTALNESAWLGLEYFEVQIAEYPGGGARYDRHLDAFPGSDNRRVTAIVYLNDAWTPAAGGELRIFPADAEPVVVEPVLDRLVVFLSDQLEHEVLPSWQPRYAMTAWYRRRAPFRVPA